MSIKSSCTKLEGHMLYICEKHGHIDMDNDNGELEHPSVRLRSLTWLIFSSFDWYDLSLKVKITKPHQKCLDVSKYWSMFNVNPPFYNE